MQVALRLQITGDFFSKKCACIYLYPVISTGAFLCMLLKSFVALKIILKISFIIVRGLLLQFVNVVCHHSIAGIMV